LSLGAFVAINPRLRWFLSAALREIRKNPASGEARIAVHLGIYYLSLRAFVAINPRLPWLLFAALRGVKKSSFWRSRIAANKKSPHFWRL